MKSPAITICWQIWSRHRLGLSLSGVSLLLMVLFFPPLLLRFDNTAAFLATIIPATLVSAFIVNAVLFTEEVGSMTSGYPRRMLTLPVATGVLAFWPLLLGVLSVVTLWLAIAGLIYQRGGYRPPLVLPAMALAVCIAWIQTVCWMPIKNPLIRSYVMIMGICMLLVVPAWLGFHRFLSSSQISVLGGLELLGLYGLARLGLAYDRKGQEWTFGADRVADWYGSVLDRSSRPRPDFANASAAQEWYESSCHSRMLMGMMILMLCLMGAAYLWVRRNDAFAHRVGLAAMLGMPLMLAGSQGFSLGRVRPLWSKQRGPITFLAVRPIPTGAMVDAKYRMVAHYVATIWLMTVAMAVAAVIIKGRASDVSDLLQSYLLAHPGWRGWAVIGLAIVLAPIFHWKILTDHVVAVLAGRRWLAEGSEFLGAMILLGLIVAGGWYVGHPELVPHHLPILVWMLAALVVVKCLVAVVGFRVGLDRGLLEVRSVRRLLAFLAVSAVATLTFAHLIIPAGVVAVPRPVLLVASLSALPLARFALAPLALDWNRHR
jgi:hypothetical protein